MQEHPSRRSFLKKAALAGSGVVLGAAGLNELSPKIWPEPIVFEPNQSYWAKSQPPQNPPLAENLTADVVVLGGGFTGLSSAYFIRTLSRQKRVVLLEANGCGNGASGRNGAMVLNLTDDRYMQLGPDPAVDKRIYDLTARNIQTLSKLSAITGIDCELETNGALQVLNTSNDVRDAQLYVQAARAAGMPVEFWNKQQVASAIGTGLYEGAFFDPNGGHIHPMKLVQVWKAAAQSVGAEIYENTVVTHIEEGPQNLVHTMNGFSVKAKSLVLATNAFTSRLGYFRNSIVPVHEYVAMTPPLSDHQVAQIGWPRRAPFNDNRTEVIYLGLTRDNRIHIGGGSPGYFFNNGVGDPNESVRHYAYLQRELVRVYPALEGVEFEALWSGIVDWVPQRGALRGAHRKI